MKHIKYLKYVLRHKWFVFIECCKVGQVWRGLTHDLSKFLPSEWFPYAEAFYGEYGYNFNPDIIPYVPDGYSLYQIIEGRRLKHKISMESFDRAWLLHQHAQ